MFAVTDGLYHGAVLSDRDLANLEMAGGLIIYLADNGVPLRFSGAWDPPSGRAQLVELARRQAADRGLDGTTDQRVDGLSITGPQETVTGPRSSACIPRDRTMKPSSFTAALLRTCFGAVLSCAMCSSFLAAPWR